MGDTKHVCGASGFGLGLDDVCPACQEHNAEMAIKRETPAQAFERGRQLGMEQAGRERAKSSRAIEAMPPCARGLEDSGCQRNRDDGYCARCHSDCYP